MLLYYFDNDSLEKYHFTNIEDEFMIEKSSCSFSRASLKGGNQFKAILLK